ncbi:MAG: hypothetical protein KI790_14670 [Cyclobacteriaceae bacterium]|nr:hypothetical protein [Cyclobacteriaceae bacterium HetDA_MAG_MS6]
MNWIILIDFGLLVLVWTVQLVVYPGFRYYTPSDLQKWHGKYTSNITIIVLPLMLSQLLLHGIQAISKFHMLSSFALFLVICTWFITFWKAVPLHQQITESRDEDTQLIAQKLVSINWYRTLIWTAIFIINFF